MSEPSGRATPATAGDWVLIHSVVLPAGSRAPGVPAETQTVPLELRVKGFLRPESAPALPGDEVEVTTLTGRTARGRLLEKSPPIPHDFGAPVPELLVVGPELRARLRADADGGRGDR